MLRLALLSTLVAVSLAFSRLPTEQPSSALKMARGGDAEDVAEVQVGDKIPSVILAEGQAEYSAPREVDLAELIKGKKVAIFAVPGAFTPRCSKSHLPSFIATQDDLKAKGAEMTICVATNDAFVMEVSARRRMEAGTLGGRRTAGRPLGEWNGPLGRIHGRSLLHFTSYGNYETPSTLVTTKGETLATY